MIFFILLREKQQWGNLLWGVKSIKRKKMSHINFDERRRPLSSVIFSVLHLPTTQFACGGPPCCCILRIPPWRTNTVNPSSALVVKWFGAGNNEEAIRRTQNAARRRALRGTFSLDLESERWYIWVSIYANLSARTIWRKKALNDA